MSDINFKISVKEANIIFKALGNLPFSEVYELIGKLNDQANAQLKNENHELNGKGEKESLGLNSSPNNKE